MRSCCCKGFDWLCVCTEANSRGVSIVEYKDVDFGLYCSWVSVDDNILLEIDNG